MQCQAIEDLLERNKIQRDHLATLQARVASQEHDQVRASIK
jgi:hypothetical protein